MNRSRRTTMNTRHTAAVTVLLAAAVVPANAVIINVPGDQPTIQAGIDAAVDGDEVVVAPGTYLETINFIGKAQDRSPRINRPISQGH